MMMRHSQREWELMVDARRSGKMGHWNPEDDMQDQ